MTKAKKTRRKPLRPVWRRIIKKNERQGRRLFDVLICQHAVPANDNKFRVCRDCPTCAEAVERIRKEHERISRSHRGMMLTSRSANGRM